MALLIRAPNPIWYMVDTDGVPLNDEYYAFFLTNTVPYLPQAPFRDPEGTTLWTGGIVQFQPSGTLPNNLYFDDSLTYRVEVRHGNSSTDPLIWLIENFEPGAASVEPASNELFNSDNQISNPQFANVNFVNTLTYTQAVSGTYTVDVAPGWVLELVGQGTTVLTHLNQPGSDHIDGNPPYALRVNNSGWTSASLYQRFDRNGAIFASGAVSMAISLRASSSPQDVTLVYSPSSGAPEQIAQGTIGVGSYTILKGAIDLPISSNTDIGDSAYVDIIVELDGTGSMDVTNVQVLGQSENLPTDFDPETDTPNFREETIERQQDHLYHYYADSLLRQSKGNILTGWTFGINPWQFRSYTSANVAGNEYTADQTIIVQQNYVSNIANTNNVAVGALTVADNYDLEVKAVTANNKFAIIQYIDPSVTWPYWGEVMSAMVIARIKTTHSSTIRVKAKLIYRSSLPPTISQNEPVQSWSATAGFGPTLAAGWQEIKAINDPIYTLTSEHQKFNFDGFQLPAADNDAMTLGIMIYTIDEMDETATADSVVFRRVSLVNNDFAIDTPPETFDECLRKCQFYYEKSYDYGVLPGTSTAANSVSIYSKGDDDGSGTIEVWPPRLYFKYKTTKRAISSNSFTIYSLTGTASNVSFEVVNGTNGSLASLANRALSTWTLTDYGLDSVTYNCNNTTTLYYSGGTVQNQGYTKFHYVIDARLGK